MLYIILFMIVVSVIGIRVHYINALCDDWNYYLSIYIKNRDEQEDCSSNRLDYFKKYQIKGWKYYFRIDVWFIEDIINDPFLIDDIKNQIQSRYIK